MAWRLNPALTNFRSAVNACWPDRDKTSDGIVGDPAHQATSSDHNPDPDGSVDAWDMDVNLRSGDDAAAIEHLKRVFQAHEASRYWIHNRRIASRSDGWVRRYYDGANPHDKHVHWNTRSSHEDSTDPWEIDMPLTDADADRVVDKLLGTMLGRSGPTVGVALQSTYGTVQTVAGAVTRLGEVVAAESSNPDEVRAALSALPAPPTAEEVAEATVRRLGEESPDAAAQTLLAVLGPDRTAALGAALTAAATLG